MSSVGLPLLANRDVTVEGASACIKFLKDTQSNIDARLSKQDQADSDALAILVNDLKEAELYEWWCVPENYWAITRPLHGEQHIFPLNHLVPLRRRLHVISELKEKGGVNTDEIYARAARVYRILSDRLADSLYFFNDQPSSLDAIVFGHLAVQYYAPLPNPRLACEIHKYGNLIAFCNRILLNHFRMAPREVNPTQAREASKTAGPPKSELLSAGVFLGVVGVLMGATYYFSSSDKQ